MQLQPLDCEILGVLDLGPAQQDSSGDAVKDLIDTGTNLHDADREDLVDQLDLLEKAGYVDMERVPGPGRRRWMKISITEEGRAALASAPSPSSNGSSASSGSSVDERPIAEGFASLFDELSQLRARCEESERDLSRAIHERDGAIATCDSLRAELDTITAERDRLAAVVTEVQSAVEAAVVAAP